MQCEAIAKKAGRSRSTRLIRYAWMHCHLPSLSALPFQGDHPLPTAFGYPQKERMVVPPKLLRLRSSVRFPHLKEVALLFVLTQWVRWSAEESLALQRRFSIFSTAASTDDSAFVATGGGATATIEGSANGTG